ncbi:hypothetical protein C8F01DRAFT_947767, partial [Mycena amicta]
LYPSDGNGTVFVEVPVRLGGFEPKSPYDLDVTWWIGMGSGPEASSYDMDATAITVKRWPADDTKCLKRSYTIFCSPQSTNDYQSSVVSQPLNRLVNSMIANVQHRCWRGNILVMRSLPHHGKK